MKKKLLSILFILLVTMVICIPLSACGSDVDKNSYCTVSFDTDGGSSIENQQVEKGGRINKPIDPTKDGYEFLGWYFSDEEWSFVGFFVTNDMTLTAKWQQVNYSVGLVETDVYAGSVLGLGTYNYLDEVDLTIITNVGYNFLGLYKDDKLLTTNTTYSFTMPCENVKLTVKWDCYTVTVTKSDYNAGNVNNYNQTKVAVGTDIKLSATTNKGYNFLGWYDNEDNLITSNTEYSFVMERKNVNFVAKWDFYTVLTTQNDYYAGRVNYEYEAKISVGEQVTISATTNEGYNFLGWYDKEDNLISNNAEYSFTMLKQNYSFVAKWNYFTVTTNKQDYYSGSINSYNQKKVSIGEEVSLKATTNDGYNFIGWFNENNTLISPLETYVFTMTTENVNLTAKWDYFTVTTNRADYNSGMINYYNNTKISAGKEVTLTATTNYGYNFLGWYDENENLVSNKANYTFTMERKNLNLTAKWNYFTLTLNAEDTASCSFATNYNNTKVSIGVDLELECLPHLGYDFIGWYKDDILLGTNCKYQYTMKDENIVFEARCKAKDEMSAFVFTSTVSTCTVKEINDKTISSIQIPECITAFGTSVFDKCNNLKAVYITSLEKWCAINFANWTSNPLYFAHNLYLNNELVEKLIIPNGVTEIKSNAFYNCTSIISVIMSDTVKSIGTSAFDQCTNLNKVEVSDISKWCTINFANWTSNPLYFAHNLYLNKKLVTSIDITDGTTKISDNAFYNCTSIETVIIPKSITAIGTWAFANCTNLKEVYYKGNSTDWAKISLSNIEDKLSTATRYYYSETLPTIEGNFWYYDLDGQTPVKW